MQKIVFMGTPSFAVPILKDLVKSNDYDVLAVVTQPDRPFGRKRVLKASPVKLFAEEANIDILQPEKISGSKEMQKIIDLSPDFIITAAFGQFLPTKLLNAAKVAAVNVHGSLLPKYRGGAPVQYSIMNGDDRTGISIMYMVKKMDAGDILAQESIKIEENDDTASMFDKLSILGSKLLLETLPKIVDGSVKPIAQDESKVVFSPNIKRSEEQLDFNKTAFLVDRKVRALRPDPSAFTFLKGKRTKIWQTKVVNDEKTDLAPGQVVIKTKKSLKIACGNGTVISIIELQPAGKPKQNINAYLNGAGQSIKEKEQVITNE
ncbi:methionyl-tRNA formyltransferase [Apilactobacillus micheneri]|uniref:Methionyl-tRNA formyltransferase n=1 Tax=Apilactobacillus micheneri TaxID=1899430 RepID=A0ABY2YX15_9LACO|nr:methionyl-tRNA formyltransferase [Apilactobacillus micheneri]TPR25515.1 methionyl-tRNA formyltransferase [Apilactobacillus micheneri]TPR26619.1 methionyl-tRNA formyltransferase [Apilactobacillus micheneri]TPR28406.1 methionyl-tRNA formyltransferase [Apilactobacillus micheneri]TPR29093.1 methionyl-tRNA formyltransferase [Apilactobacillus micheneri]TPR30682.1 methionyl-tRNA formyltransferase [Apilactobacillus micheneri]